MSKDEEGRNFSQELEAMKRKNQDLLTETETFRAKVICLESEKNEALSQLRRYRDALTAHKKELTGLQEHLFAKRELENQVENHKRQITELQNDLDRLRDLLKETENDTRKYQLQYQDSMDLIEKLTANNVDLKIKVSAFSTELDSLKSSHSTLKRTHDELQTRFKETEAGFVEMSVQLETEKMGNCDDVKDLREQLQVKDEELQRLRLEGENSENEKRLLSRSYNATLKDLKRQLTAATKSHNGNTENGNGNGDGKVEADGGSLKSRASSSSSLDTSPSLSVVRSLSHHNTFISSHEDSNSSPQTSSEIDRTLLIDKIVSLQRELARKDEKCDFLEDHIALLTAELRKRTK